MRRGPPTRPPAPPPSGGHPPPGPGQAPRAGARSGLAGLVLYESAPTTGPEHGAEAGRMIGEFVARNRGNPEVPGVIAALQSVGTITDDAGLTRALRALVPAYFADYWGREDEFASVR